MHFRRKQQNDNVKVRSQADEFTYIVTLHLKGCIFVENVHWG